MGSGRTSLASRRDEPMVARPRLRRLLEAVGATSVVLTAPAGYGKSTVARQWLAHRPAVAWCRATGADAPLFVRDVASALGDSWEALRKEAAGLAEERPAVAAARVAELAEADPGRPQPAFLVIDDYHLAAVDPELERFVDRLREIPGLTLVVLTRRSPSWATQRASLYGEVAEFGVAELALDQAETDAIVAAAGGAVCEPLLARSDGWTAAVRLALVAGSAGIGEARAFAAFGSFLAQEVVALQPPEVQELMLEAGAARVVRAQDFGDDAARERIARLAADGVLTPTEDGALRFHPLLRAWLRRRLAGDDPPRARRLFQAALRQARDGERWEEAFELALELGDAKTAVTVAAEGAPALIERGQTDEVARWIERCGRQALEEPALALAHAAWLLRHGRFREAAALARDLATRLPPGDPHISRAWYLASQSLNLLADRRQALVCAERAGDAALTDHERTHALLMASLIAARLELPTAAAYLEQLESAAGQDLEGRLKVGNARIDVAVKSGSLAGLWQAIEPLIAIADTAGVPLLRASLLANAAQVASLRCDYAMALTLAERAAETCRRHGIEFGLDFSVLYRARAEIGLRRFRAARESLRRLKHARDRQDDNFRVEYELANLQLAIACDELEAIPEAASDRFAGDLSPAVCGTYSALVGLVAAVRGESERALAELDTAKNVTRSVEARFYASFAELVTGLAAGRPEEHVQKALADALRECADADALGTFVVAYRACPRLLALAASDTGSEPLARAVVLAAGDRAFAGVAAPGWIIAADAGAPPPALTPRELEVLELLAEGLSNVAIAERLVISPSTAKVHVHRVLGKLGARDRLEAARLASQLLAPAAGKGPTDRFRAARPG
jgi:LuxR family transcriptional regulator, maltose regulon positive regulatory protein